MKLETFAEHTIDVDRLKGGVVLDVGCRNFTFARAMVDRGCTVVALDADPTVEHPGIDGVLFLNLALAHHSGTRALLMHDNPEARCLAPIGLQVQMPQVTVDAVTLTQLMELTGVTHWDAVKLDVEGAEYDILRAWPGNVAGQISIEFHEHCMGKQSDETYRQLFAHVGQWYDIARHVRDNRHCAGENFWDSLLVDRNQ